MNEFTFRGRATRRPYAELNTQTRDRRDFDALVIEAGEAHEYPDGWPTEGVDVTVTVRPTQTQTIKGEEE